MLADPFRLEGEAAGAAWQRPDVPPETASLRAAIGELDRGLAATRPDYLTWICQKLGSMPTQNGDGVNAAIWADNVHDVCGHYPEDLLQATCLELLRTKTFRPQPAEIVAVLEPKYAERQRMLDRCKAMLAPRPAIEAPEGPSKILTEPQRIAHLRRVLGEQAADTGHPYQRANMANTERALAFAEKRAMATWAQEFFDQQRAAREAVVATHVAKAARSVVATLAPDDFDEVTLPEPAPPIADDYGHLASG